MVIEKKGQGHPECYAQALGECSGSVNREHYVSESILEIVNRGTREISKSVLVRGLRFQQPGVLEEKGVGRLVAKVLCERHNSYLGQRLDPAGLAMFKAMEVMNDAPHNRSAHNQTCRVNGDDLERWILKTFIGGLFSGNFAVTHGETMKGVYPPQDLAIT